MGDKPNPFSAKAKNKSKLKAFGSGKRKGGVKTAPPPKRAMPPARVKPKPENPLRKKLMRRAELEKVEAQIAQLMADYDAAFEVEIKLSKRWEKLKPGTNPYAVTEKKWHGAMRDVERIQSRLLGLSAVRRKLKAKL